MASNAARMREWAAQIRITDTLEIRLRSKLKSEFERVGKAAATSYRVHHKVEQNVYRDHVANVTAILAPATAAAMKVFAVRTQKRLNGKSTLAAIEQKYTEAELEKILSNAAMDNAKRRSLGIDQTTQDRVNAIIAQAAGEGISPGDVGDMIEEETGGEIGGWRAETIARTETHSASQYGSLEGAKAMGLPGLKKVWIATHDDRTREDHLDADDQEVDLDEPFDVGGEELIFPGDPSGSAENVINCRCVMDYNSDAAAEDLEAEQ